jgi:membrane protein DedA with SNARE-associated domain
MTDMEYYIRTYGYVGIVVWTILGGEEGVIVSAILASQGYFALPGVILASALGGSMGDQIFFYLARRYGERLVNRSEKVRSKYPKAAELVAKYGAPIVLLSRFMAGLRITIPIVCGTLRMPALKYSSLNLISGLMWATVVAMLSYYSGRLLGEWFHGSMIGLWGGLIVMAVLFLIVRYRRRRKSAAELMHTK